MQSMCRPGAEQLLSSTGFLFGYLFAAAPAAGSNSMLVFSRQPSSDSVFCMARFRFTPHLLTITPHQRTQQSLHITTCLLIVVSCYSACHCQLRLLITETQEQRHSPVGWPALIPWLLHSVTAVPSALAAIPMPQPQLPPLSCCAAQSSGCWPPGCAAPLWGNQWHRPAAQWRPAAKPRLLEARRCTVPLPGRRLRVMGREAAGAQELKSENVLEGPLQRCLLNSLATATHKAVAHLPSGARRARATPGTGCHRCTAAPGWRSRSAGPPLQRQAGPPVGQRGAAGCCGERFVWRQATGALHAAGLPHTYQ